MGIKYCCPNCGCDTKELNARLKQAGFTGVIYYCDCKICSHTTTVTSCSSILRLSDLTKKLKLERFFLN